MWITPSDYITIDDGDVSLTIVESTLTHPEGEWYYPLHAHEWFDLVFCVSGEGRAVIHNTSINMQRGMVTVIKPNTFHGYYSTTGSDFGYIVLSIANNPDSPLCRFFSSSETVIADLGDDIDYAISMFDVITREAEGGMSKSSPLYYTSFLSMLYLMKTALINRPINTPISRNLLSEQILEYIHEHFSEEDLCLDSIAAHCFRSVSQISRLFRDSYNISIVNYLIDYRIRIAKDYLSGTNEEIKDISYMIGYSNVNYFTRIFKKRVGISPVEYRRRFSRRSASNLPMTMSQMRSLYGNKLHIEESHK